MFSPDKIRDEELRELHGYWLSKRRDGGLPARRDIDPLEVPRLLKHLALLEVVGDAEDFVFVLAGSRIEDVHGRTLKGVSLGDLREDLEESPSIVDYVAAVRSGEPQYQQASLKEYGKEHWACRRLILPLSSDGARVDCLLLGAVFSSLGDSDHDAWLAR